MNRYISTMSYCSGDRVGSACSEIGLPMKSRQAGQVLALLVEQHLDHLRRGDDAEFAAG